MKSKFKVEDLVFIGGIVNAGYIFETGIVIKTYARTARIYNNLVLYSNKSSHFADDELEKLNET